MWQWLILGTVVWGGFMLDAYLITKAPKKRHPFTMPSREDEDDLLYTLPREWVRRARERMHHD